MYIVYFVFNIAIETYPNCCRVGNFHEFFVGFKHSIWLTRYSPGRWRWSIFWAIYWSSSVWLLYIAGVSTFSKGFQGILKKNRTYLLRKNSCIKATIFTNICAFFLWIFCCSNKFGKFALPRSLQSLLLYLFLKPCHWLKKNFAELYKGKF